METTLSERELEADKIPSLREMNFYVHGNSGVSYEDNETPSKTINRNVPQNSTVLENDVRHINQLFSSMEMDVENISNNTEKTGLKYNLDKLLKIEKEGDSWDSDYKTLGPNRWALEIGRSIIKACSEFEIYPISISQSVEEGLTFVFENGSRRMYLEVYNDKELGNIIEDFRQQKELSNTDFEIRDCLSIILSFCHMNQ